MRTIPLDSFFDIRNIYNITYLNYYYFIEYYNKLNTYNNQKEKMIIENCNRLLINFLSTGILFLNYIYNKNNTIYKCLSLLPSAEAELREEIDNYKNEVYKSYSYRIMYYLRNFTQHAGLPIYSITTDIVKMDKGITPFIYLYINGKYLLEHSTAWKREVKADLLANPGDIDCIPLAAEYMHQLRRFYEIFLKYYYLGKPEISKESEYFVTWKSKDRIPHVVKINEKKMGFDNYKYSKITSDQFGSYYAELLKYGILVREVDEHPDALRDAVASDAGSNTG